MINIFQTKGDEVRVVGRDKAGKRTIQDIKHTPYFYYGDPEGKLKDIFGKPVTKKEVKNSWDISKERDQYEETYESDLYFADRVLIDKFDNIEKEPLRIMYFDIETDNCGDEINTPKPITCIGTKDSFSGKKIGFVWHKNEETRVKYDNSNNKVFYFDNEKAMLRMFIKYFLVKDFDIFAGWFSNGFDTPYIVNRCKKLGITEIDRISMGGDIKLGTKNKYNTYDIKIDGRYSFDLLQIYKKLTFHELDSYKLDDIGKLEVKDYKIPFEGDFSDLWNRSRDELMDYCFQDVELCELIDKKRDLINYFDNLRRLVGCRWEALLKTTMYHDIYFLRYAKKLGVVLPKKKQVDVKGKYSGGYVGQAKPGVHNNVVVVDLESLYPNIIRTFNLSPETKVPTGNIKFKHLRFTEDKIGICPQICSDIIIKRKEVKKLAKEEFEKNGKSEEWKKLDAIQYALKVVVNSLYGALGTPYFRMYDRDIANTITTLGREIILWSSKVAEDLGYDVLYNDTDSVFIKIKNSEKLSTEEILNVGIKIGEDITKSYKEFVSKLGVTKPHTLNMVFEKIFTKIFFGSGSDGKASKKRYVGYILDKKGKENFAVKGFEIVRSDSAKIERTVMRSIYELILSRSEKDAVKRLLNTYKRDIREGSYSLSDIAIRRGVKKMDRSDIYTEAIRYSNKYLGTKYKNGGNKIKMLFVESMPSGYSLPEKRTIAFEKDEQVPKGTKIDYDKMFDRLFDKKIERIYSALGWGKQDKSRINQARLF